MKILTFLAQQEVPNGDTKRDLINLPQIPANEDQLQKLLAIVFGLAAAIAVIVILVASIEMVTNGDNPETIAKARRTIIYALIGLTLAVSAEAIVLTVLGSL